MDLTVSVGGPAADAVRKFLDADPDRERGGFLLGDWSIEGRCVTRVSEFVPCPDAPGSPVSLTFRPEEWQLVHTHPCVARGTTHIVGWAHSHPGMPVGMSDRDVFIHRHFFSGPCQVAWIRDPVGDREAIWTLRDGKPTLVDRLPDD